MNSEFRSQYYRHQGYGSDHPKGFKFLVNQGTVRFGQWRLLTQSDAAAFAQFIRGRYGRPYTPIAHREGSDDVACLEDQCGEVVRIVNGYTKPGEEVMATFGTFWDWFRSVVDDMIDFAWDDDGERAP